MGPGLVNIKGRKEEIFFQSKQGKENVALDPMLHLTCILHEAVHEAALNFSKLCQFTFAASFSSADLPAVLWSTAINPSPLLRLSFVTEQMLYLKKMLNIFITIDFITCLDEHNDLRHGK